MFIALLATACGTTGDAAFGDDAGPTASPADVEQDTLTPTPMIELADELASDSTSTTTTTTTTTLPATTTTPPIASSTIPLPPDPQVDAEMTQTNTAFDALARNNAVASLTVQRDGEILLSQASGTLVDGTPATSDSPMLVASVSKVITAFMIAKLEQRGDISMAQPMPWSLMGIPTHPGWADVTVREVLDHTSGMPVARNSWSGGPGDCRSYLPFAVNAAPQQHRGEWRYSNGNYCALGLLAETLTALPLDAAAQELVFDPLGRDGVHTSTGGLLPTDATHSGSVARLSRLGGAGVFIVSTADLAAMIGSVSTLDLDTIQPPGIFVDQYGWGHTGTLNGAVSCLWLLDGGRTAIAATIAGSSPSTGGGICDRVVPAVANDLGLGQGRPSRTP